uniref:DUF4042 domain-containing protein n=1 Tax=Macrostomum lignano TaxID=282301 RepID=A0A1I8FRY8_9PLAT
AYLEFDGDMDKVLESVLFADYPDEDRIAGIIRKLIDSGEVPAFEAFTLSRPLRKRAENAPNERERREFDKANAEEKRRNGKGIVGLEDEAEEENGLAKAIQLNMRQRAGAMESLIDSLAAKYGGRRHRGDYFERGRPSPSVPKRNWRSRNRQQGARAAGKIRANSEWLARLIPSAIGADRARVLLRRQLEADVAAPPPDKWRGGGGGSRRPPRGAGEGGTRRPGFQSANGDMAAGGGSSSMANRPTATASLDTFDLQRLDAVRAEAGAAAHFAAGSGQSARPLSEVYGRANCARRLWLSCGPWPSRGPDSETAQRVLSPDAVAILLQLLPRLQPGDEAPGGAAAVPPSRSPWPLSGICCPRLASSESNSSQDLNSAGANLQLLAALVPEYEGETLSGEGDELQFVGLSILCRSSTSGTACPPDLVSTLLTAAWPCWNRLATGPSARVLGRLLLHLLTFLISRVACPIRPADLPRLLNQLRRYLWHGLPPPNCRRFCCNPMPLPMLQAPVRTLSPTSPSWTQFDSLAALPGVTARDSDEEANGSLEQRLSGLDLRDADLADLMLNRDERQQQASSVSLADAKVRFISGSCLRRLVESLHKRGSAVPLAGLLPDPGRPSFLLALLLREPNSRVRGQPIGPISEPVSGARKLFLLLAEDFGVPKTAFTPLSTRLAGSLREMHRQILQALLAERSQATQAQLLRLRWSTARKCALPENCARASSPKIFKVASPFLLSESPDVKSARPAVLRASWPSLEGPAFEVSHCLPAGLPPLARRLAMLNRISHASAGTRKLRRQQPGQSQQQAALEPTAVTRGGPSPPCAGWCSATGNFVSPVSEQLRLTLSSACCPESNRAVRAASVRALDRSADLAAARGRLPPLPAVPACNRPPHYTASAPPLPNASRLLDDASSANLPSELLGDAFQALLALCQDGLNTVRAAAVRALGAWTALSPIRFRRIMARRLLALVWRFADLCAGIESLVVRPPGRLVAGSGLGGSPSPVRSSRYPPSPPLLSEADLARGRGHLRACIGAAAATGLANLVTPGGAPTRPAPGSGGTPRWLSGAPLAACQLESLGLLCLHSALLGALQSDKYFK